MKKTKDLSKTTRRGVPTALEAIRPMVAGIDVGSREHWVCGPAREDGEPNVRVFGTTTAQLEALVVWLAEQGTESVAMESTSVYWIPLYELLESRGIEAVLVNAHQMRNVPGRKTDFHDCQWLQLLHSCGLLRGSFRPGPTITALRATHRQLANLVEERSRCVQWMQKALDQMNVQVHRAVADLTGTTGMAIVRAIVAGERDPGRLSALRHPQCRKSAKEIAAYLTGTWRQEHLFNLDCALQLHDKLETLIADYEARLLGAIARLQSEERKVAKVPMHPNRTKQSAITNRGDEPTRAALWRTAGVDLTRIDGINVGAAKVIVTEVGLDLSAFPSEHHFASWLRLCPRRPISGGKPLKSKRNGLGAHRIANALRMAAVSLRHTKTALGAAYRRIARLKGADVAVFAMARKLVQLVYRMLRYGQDYVDIGDTVYESRFQARRLAGLKEAARSMGYSLNPDPAGTVAPTG
jgi:transposase